MNTNPWVVLFSITLLVWSGTCVRASTQKDKVTRNDVGKSIIEIVETAGDAGFSGVVLAELHGEVIAAVATGSRGDENESPNTTETLFEIASVTKPLTAVAILVLADQGKLSLDDPIDKHLPGVPDNCKAITVRHLLQHTSGIPATNYGPHTTDVAEIVPIYLTGGPQHEPGTHHEYWNQGYSLLSAIVARTNGTEYTEAMRQLVYEPTGMDSSCFTGDPASDHDNVAVGQSEQGPSRSALEPPYGDFYGLQYQGMGGAVCNVRDLHHLIKAIREGDFLTEETRQTMLQPGPGNCAISWYVKAIGQSQRRVYHTGGVRGFKAAVSWYPDDKASLIVLSSSENPKTFFDVTSACQNLLESEFVTVPEQLRFSKEFIDSITGQYSLGARTVTLTADGDKIDIMFDWGRGLRTAGVLEKGEGDKLNFATVTNETIELIPGPAPEGRINSLKLMDDNYERR